MLPPLPGSANHRSERHLIELADPAHHSNTSHATPVPSASHQYSVRHTSAITLSTLWPRFNFRQFSALDLPLIDLFRPIFFGRKLTQVTSMDDRYLRLTVANGHAPVPLR